MRYERETSIVLNPDGVRPSGEAAPYIGRARKFLGNLFEECSFNNIPSLFRTHILQDGTVIRVGKVMDAAYIQITTSGGKEEEIIIVYAGIISVPINDECVTGWGRPFDDENEPLGTCGGSYPNVLAVVGEDKSINLLRSITAPEWGTAGGSSPATDKYVDDWTVSWDTNAIYHKGVLIHNNGGRIQGVYVVRDSSNIWHVISVGYHSTGPYEGKVRIVESELLGSAVGKTHNTLGLETLVADDSKLYHTMMLSIDRNGHGSGSFLYNHSLVPEYYNNWDIVYWEITLSHSAVDDTFSYEFSTSTVVHGYDTAPVTDEYKSQEWIKWHCGLIFAPICSQDYTVIQRVFREETIIDYVKTVPIFSSPAATLTIDSGSYIAITNGSTSGETEASAGTIEHVYSYNVVGKYGDYTFDILTSHDVITEDNPYWDNVCITYEVNSRVQSATIYIDPNHDELFFVKQSCETWTNDPPSFEQLYAGITGTFEITGCIYNQSQYYVTTYDKIIAVAYGQEIVIGYTNFDTQLAVTDVTEVGIHDTTSNIPDVIDLNPCGEYPNCSAGNGQVDYFPEVNSSSSTFAYLLDKITIEKISVIRCAFGVLLHTFNWQELTSADSANNSFTYKSSYWSYMTTKGASPGPEEFYEFAGTDPQYTAIGLW